MLFYFQYTILFSIVPKYVAFDTLIWINKFTRKQWTANLTNLWNYYYFLNFDAYHYNVNSFPNIQCMYCHSQHVRSDMSDFTDISGSADFCNLTYNFTLIETADMWMLIAVYCAVTIKTCNTCSFFILPFIALSDVRKKGKLSQT